MFKEKLEQARGNWQDKLGDYECELSITASPPQKFELQRRIKECKEEIKRIDEQIKRIEQQAPPAPVYPNVNHNKTTEELLEIRLNKLLTAGRWKEADQETWHILWCLSNGYYLAIEDLDRDKVPLADTGNPDLDSMLKWARKDELEKGYSSHLYIEDIYQLPCGVALSTINKLWVNSSDGQFGFSVQKEIYQGLGGWKAFAESVGWRRGGRWLSYRDLTFSLNAPKGHLPSFYICHSHDHSHDELSSYMSLFPKNPLEALEETLRFPLDFSGKKRTREFNKNLRILEEQQLRREEQQRGRNFASFVQLLGNCDI